MKNAGLKTWLALTAVLTLCGALLGAAALAVKPASYTSSAATTISTDPRTTDPSLVQGVTASIFMMMPAYAAMADGPDVSGAAARASGVQPAEVPAALDAQHSIDSTVLKWTYSASDPEKARAGLQAAVDTFAKKLPATGPQAKAGPILTVAVQPATLGSTSLTPTLGALAGALAGLLAGVTATLLMYRGASTTVADWDETQNRFGVPVVAEITDDDDRSWRYVADRLGAGAGQAPVGVFTAGRPVHGQDVAALGRALEGAGHHGATAVDRGSVAAADRSAWQGLSSAVVVIPADAAAQAAADVRALRGLVTGPVVAVLDRRRARRS